ncbi:MAG: acyl-CoA synthase [Osedax symbiont Rs2]|nr:MAG: acyl-CoA synthase [Osedax symbiont Rs2]
MTQFATAKIGAILVNVNPAYQLSELEFTLNQSGISFLVMADRFKKSDYCQMLTTLAPELQHCAAASLQAARVPLLKVVVNLSEQRQRGMLRWADFCDKASQIEPSQLLQSQQQLHFNDPINIQYTSGTTGSPKGVTLSHYNILNNGFFVTQSMNFSHRDKLIIPVPLYHCFGMVMGNIGCVSHGATMIYPSAAFDPLAVLQAVADEKATALYAVPTMFISMLEHPQFNSFELSSLRTGIMAGSICPAEIMRAVNDKMHMHEIQIAYGMTETSPVSSQSAADDSFERRMSTVGRTQPHIEHKIIDPDSGMTTVRNVAGELCTRGYSVMLGYWQSQQATQSVIQSDGWLRTGDLATMDEQGYIRIVGRIKDMVIRGGENIYPKEVEDFLYAHPHISDVQITGVPDQKYGEELVAWIILRPDAPAMDTESIVQYCRGNISHYKIPRYIKFVDSYPMTVTGKVQKFKIREMAIEELQLE